MIRIVMGGNNKIIKAKDCLPFYINGNETAEGAIGEKENARVISNEVKVLSIFIDSIVPISIFGSELKDEDTDSKLAYSPFENKHYTWNENGIEKKRRVWQAGRYVGATQIDNTTIEISPRFGNGWLEYLLDDVTHFKVVKSGSEKEEKGINDLMRRILWYLWVRKFAYADQYGLPKRVVKHTHIGLQIRGHLNVRKSLFPLFTKGQVVSEYREKDIDDAICRIVYKAYCILVNRKYNKSQVPSQIQDSLNTLYSYYQGQPISVSANDYNNLSYKSIYLRWKPLVDFSWQIIQQDSLFKRRGSKGDSLSIFLDMAEIWEAFLRKKLGERLAEDGWRVWSVEECHRPIYEKTFFNRVIIPDIILQKEDKFIIFDAKYKRMRGVKKKVKESDVDRADLFQIHTYIQYVQHHLGKVVLGGLLYPLEVDVNVSNLTDFHSDQLFGIEGKEAIPFIIDGIYCNEKEMNSIKPEEIAKEMGKRVEDMINRIKKYTN